MFPVSVITISRVESLNPTYSLLSAKPILKTANDTSAQGAQDLLQKPLHLLEIGQQLGDFSVANRRPCLPTAPVDLEAGAQALVLGRALSFIVACHAANGSQVSKCSDNRIQSSPSKTFSARCAPSVLRAWRHRALPSSSKL